VKYIKLPVLWQDEDIALLEDLGIETDYDQSTTKQIYMNRDAVKWFYSDKDTRYTCIHLEHTEMVVCMPIQDFIKTITEVTNE
jgi:hypothetical protein